MTTSPSKKVTESTLDNNNDWRAECSALRDENRKLRKRLEAVEAVCLVAGQSVVETEGEGSTAYAVVMRISAALKGEQERGTG